MRINLTPGQARLLRERYAPLCAAQATFNATLDAVLADHLPCEVEHIEIADGSEYHVILKDPEPEA